MIMSLVKSRKSNFELLRIVAMFMVLVLHADFVALGVPLRDDVMSYPVLSTLKVFMEALSIVAVNVFVLISGWFGIRPSLRGIAKFLFQCLFFAIGAYVVMLICGNVELTLKGVADSLMLTGASYWFIIAYLCLYLLLHLYLLQHLIYNQVFFQYQILNFLNLSISKQ